MSYKIFDVHTDILYDCFSHGKKGVKTRFSDYHLNQLNNSWIKGGIWAFYSPDDFDLIKALNESIDLIDFDLIDDLEIILGLEGLRNLKSIEDLEVIYEMGFRHAMLTWNEENEYATGVAGPKGRGLTLKGKEILNFLESKDMIIDVSHLNEKSFYDVLNYTNKNIIASHSNVSSINDHRRNLTDGQLRKLKEADGLLGLTLVGSFIDKDKSNRTVDRFIDHVEYAINIMGIDNICFGFDFMDYFSEDVGSNIDEINNITKLDILVERLFKRGFSEGEIDKMLWSNFYNRYNHLVYKK